MHSPIINLAGKQTELLTSPSHRTNMGGIPVAGLSMYTLQESNSKDKVH